jgi:outer membrane murein-binding lipoprotein Lpp
VKPIIVIHQHRPWRRWIIIAVSVSILATAGWLFYGHIRATTISDFAHAQLERDRLRAENQRLEKELREARSAAQTARDDAAYASRSVEIDGQACQQVKASLTGLQTEAADLREQLAFYRGIVSPDEANAGVRVYDFKVSPLKQTANYHFDLVLIQSVRHEKRVAGKMEVSIDGLTRGQRQTLKLADIALGNSQNLLFSFKYFQEFSGDFHLPDGFRPVRATVSVVPDGAGQPVIEEPYDWSKIEQGGSE